MNLKIEYDVLKHKFAKLAVKKILNWAEGDSNIVKHMRAELPAGDPEGDDMQKQMNDHLVMMGQLFALEGHSGFSAGYAIGALNKLLDFQPLGPLTGEDSEWTLLDYADEMKWQNKRCGSVFKRADGTAYHSDRKIFREPDGMCYTGKGSQVDITFPYIPEHVYVDVDEQGNEI